MKKTVPYGILYGEDEDPRKYATQLQAEVLSAEDAFDVINDESIAYQNWVGTVASYSTTAGTVNGQVFGLSMSALPTLYGTPANSFSVFTDFAGVKSLQFNIDGWYYCHAIANFGETGGISNSSTRQLMMNQVVANATTQVKQYQGIEYQGGAGTAVGVGVQVHMMLSITAGDYVALATLHSNTASTVDITGGRMSVHRIGDRAGA